jgi:hypothetical protein
MMNLTAENSTGPTRPQLVQRNVLIQMDAFDALKRYQRYMVHRDRRTYTLGMVLDELLLTHPEIATKGRI